MIVGYHGMPWGSMGNHSKILGIPGFRGLWQVEDILVWNKTGSASSQGGSLTKHCGKKMFFLCSDGGRHCARFGRENARRPISRVLSRPLAGPWMTIPLGRPLPDASRDLPGRRRRKRAWPAPVPCGIGRPAAPMRSCSRWGLPCRPRYRRRGALLPHPFTLAGERACGARPAVCFLWHFPWGRPRRALPGTVFPWSPDFPPPHRSAGATARLSGPSGNWAAMTPGSTGGRCRGGAS